MVYSMCGKGNLDRTMPHCPDVGIWLLYISNHEHGRGKFCDGGLEFKVERSSG